MPHLFLSCLSVSVGRARGPLPTCKTESNYITHVPITTVCNRKAPPNLILFLTICLHINTRVKWPNNSPFLLSLSLHLQLPKTNSLQKKKTVKDQRRNVLRGLQATRVPVGSSLRLPFPPRIHRRRPRLDCRAAVDLDLPVLLVRDDFGRVGS